MRTSRKLARFQEVLQDGKSHDIQILKKSIFSSDVALVALI